MGNEVATSTIKWSDLSRSITKCEISEDQYILTRLNVKMDESNDEKDNNDTYLDTYLNQLSDDNLIKLFLRFGVNPDFDEKTLKKDKISALKLIASKDFWRINWKLHPLQKRVKNWLFVHEKYRISVAEIVKKASTDLDAAKNAFIKFDKKLAGHRSETRNIKAQTLISDFEDNMLFKYLEEHIDESIMPRNVLNELHKDHSDEIPKLTEKMMKCTDLKEFEALSKEYEVKTLQHLEKEEQNLIHVWLNLNEEQYKKYREYLSWKYAAVY